MIFKTYDSDIDGITNKLGFSQRSFAEWGEQVSKSFSESEGVINKFKNTINAAFVPQTGKNDALIEEFNDFIFLMNDEGLTAKETAEILGNDLSSEIQRYVKNSKDGKITTDGFKKSIGELSIGAKAGKIALQGLALVGNALAMAFASWVATEIISWLNDLAHAEENARKRSEELTSSYETEKQNIDDSIAKYKELSEKLDDTSLSTSEVKSIKEQLLGIQDQLYEKYGEEATQIDLVNGKYDEQIEKLSILSKKKANEYVNKNYNDIKEDEKYVSEKFNVNKSLGFKGSQANPDDYSGSGFDFKKYLDRYDKLDAKVVNPDGQYGMSGTVNLITSGTRQEVYDQINSLLTDLRNDFGESNPDVVALQTTLSNILKDSFDTDELANANSRIKKYTEAEILSNDNASKSYNDLVDAVDKYNTALKTGTGVDEAKEKLLETKQTAIDATENISNSGKVLQDVYNSLSNEAPIEFQVEVGKDVDEEVEKSYNDAIASAKEKYGEDLTSFFGESSINTQEEIDRWNEVAANCDTATEAKKKYLGTDDSNETPISFNQAWKDLDNPSSDELKSLKNDLTTLAESGKLTEKTFNKTSGAKTWLEQIGMDAEVAIEKINNLVDNSKQLNSLKSGIKLIQDAYADKRDNKVAGADTLSAMESEFGKLKSWDDYKSKLGSTTSSLQQCRDAQNKLATEYVNSNDFLAQLTESNKDYYVSQLKDLGVKNAQEVVDSQIENKQKSLKLAYSALSKQQKKNVKSSEELANMSGVDIATLLGEATGARKAKIELAKLAFKTTNWKNLDATQTITQLKQIAEAANLAANNIALAEDVQNNPSAYSGGSSLAAAARANGMSVEDYTISMAKDQVESGLNKKKGKTKVKTDIDVSLPKASSSSSNSNKVFDWIEIRLKWLEDKVKKTVDAIDDYATKKTKNSLFKKAKTQYNNLLHGYEKAAKTYKKKLDKINLSSSLKKKIQIGDYSIQNIKDEKTLNAIEKYQEYWDKYTSARDNILETRKNKRELIKKQLEDDIADLEDDLSLLQFEADKTQNQIDKNETKGFSATKKDYKEQISNSQKQIDKWNEEKKAYQSYLKANNISKTSDEYQDIKGKIRDIDKNISDAKKNQLEWNKSISELPYQNLEKFQTILESIASRYEKIISFWESQGHTKNENQIKKQISIGLNELSNLKKERDQKWNDIYGILSDNGLSKNQQQSLKSLYIAMRDGAITTQQFYDGISKLGISKEKFDSWDDLQTKLTEVDTIEGNILDKQTEIENNYDDLLTPWINSIQDLIDTINDLNDAQSKAIELEKLQQALQSAKQNKKNLIYREDYGFNYEADTSAIKEAQDNLDDYYNQEQLDTLNKILDWLNDHKDDMNFFDSNGKQLYPTVDKAVKAAIKNISGGMSESMKKMFDSLTFSTDKDGKITASLPKYARGTKYAKGGLSLVGEKGAELRLLNSGDQILPHDLTENLWKFGLNPTQMIQDNIKIPDNTKFIKGVGGEINNNNVSIGTVSLPNINDLSKAKDVFDALSGLSSYANQQANKR